MRVLITGGAGYVGAICAATLAEAGWDVVVYDDLSRGHRSAVRGELIVGDVRDRELLTGVLRGSGFDAVLHFAGVALVDESVREPARYIDVNEGGTSAVLDAMQVAGVPSLVFSSSCAVYGDPQRLPVDESHPRVPTSPYGTSKLLAEGAIERCTGVRVASLRYFNAAGAWPERGLGEDHEPETHLIPLAIDAALGRRAPIGVHGVDWPTADGTCVRDYVHVRDLADAHRLAVERLVEGWPGGALNIGSGRGTSVREVITAVSHAVGRDVPYVLGPRRAGDPAAVWASVDRARAELAFSPRFDLRRMVTDALAHARSR